jgi:phage-related minor tail protein
MSGSPIKGITVEINGETTGLEAALKSVGKASADINKELGLIEKGLKFDPGNTTLLAQKQELLTQKVTESKKALDAMRQAQERVEAMYKSGEIDDGQYRQFQRELQTTESKLKTFEKQVKDVDEAQKRAGDSASGWGGKVKDAAGKIGMAGGAAAVALGGMANEALNNADSLQKLSDQTGLSAERLQELQFIGDDLGVSLDTFAGAQAKLTKSMAASKDPASKQAEAFKTLGVSTVDASGNLRDAKTVMLEAFEALNGVSNETERDALSMQIFGKGAMELNPVIKAGSEELEDLAKAARDSGAVMSNEAVEGLDKFGDSLDQAKAAVLGIVGQALSKIMPALQPVINAFMKAPAPIKVVIAVVAALAVGLAALAPVIMALSAASMPLILTVGGIVLAIGALIAIIVVCIKYHEEIKQAFITAWNAIKDAFETAWDAIKTALGAMKDFFLGIWDWMKGFFAEWGPAILAVLVPFIGIPLLIYQHFGEIKQFFADLWESIKQAFVTAWDAIKGAFEAAWNAIKGAFDKAWGALKDAFWAMIDWLKGIPGWILDKFKDAGTWLLDAGKKIFTGLWDGLKWLWDHEITGWMTIGEKIKAFFVGAGHWLYDIGEDIMNGIWDGLKAVWRKIANWFKGIGSKIKNFFTGGSDTPVSINVGGMGGIPEYASGSGGLTPGGIKDSHLALVHGQERIFSAMDNKALIAAVRAMAVDEGDLFSGASMAVYDEAVARLLGQGFQEEQASSSAMEEAVTMVAESVRDPNTASMVAGVDETMAAFEAMVKAGTQIMNQGLDPTATLGAGDRLPHGTAATESVQFGASGQGDTKAYLDSAKATAKATVEIADSIASMTETMASEDTVDKVADNTDRSTALLDTIKAMLQTVQTTLGGILNWLDRLGPRLENLLTSQGFYAGSGGLTPGSVSQARLGVIHGQERIFSAMQNDRLISAIEGMSGGYSITVNGATDPDATARAVDRVMRKYVRGASPRLGVT